MTHAGTITTARDSKIGKKSGLLIYSNLYYEQFAVSIENKYCCYYPDLLEFRPMSKVAV